MNRNIFFAFTLLIGLTAFAQNTSPEVTIQNVIVDEVLQQVTITYDLTDAENHDCDVWLKVSDNGGDFFIEVDPADVSGDVGLALTPSASKTIVWDYSNFTTTIYDTKFSVHASDNQPLDIQLMVDQVDSNSLKGYLTYIEGIRHFSAAPLHLNDVRDSIETNFIRYGLDTERQLFTYGAQTGENILGRKAGMKDEAITFIIDGHYDGVATSPAADDNGTAVAGMLEVLRILSQYDFEHTIRFIGFDFEESGLIGSQRYVQNAIQPYEDLQGVLNFEMIGYYSDEVNSQSLPAGFELLFPQAVADIQSQDSRGNFLVVCGNDNSNSLITDFMAASAQYVPDLRAISLQVAGTGTIAPDLRRSDHAPFWDAGRKALMLTDGADTRNPYYHTPADTMGTLDFDFMTNIVKATLGTLAELAIPMSAGFDEYDLAVLSLDDHHHNHSASIEVYPNPTNGVVTLKIDAAHELMQRMDVYNLNGQIVETKILNVPQGESTHKLDLTNLNSGGYILIFQSKEGKVSKSLIIE
jgi:hypothetical protein